MGIIEVATHTMLYADAQQRIPNWQELWSKIRQSTIEQKILKNSQLFDGGLEKYRTRSRTIVQDYNKCYILVKTCPINAKTVIILNIFGINVRANKLIFLITCMLLRTPPPYIFYIGVVYWAFQVQYICYNSLFSVFSSSGRIRILQLAQCNSN